MPAKNLVKNCYLTYFLEFQLNIPAYFPFLDTILSFRSYSCFLDTISPICILDTIPLDINLDIVFDIIP